MFSFLKICGALLLGAVLLTLYPAYITWIDSMTIIANEIYTPSTLVVTLFKAAPIIGLVLIIWIVYKVLTAKHFNVR